jgi:Tol biopolymer transport system component
VYAFPLELDAWWNSRRSTLTDVVEPAGEAAAEGPPTEDLPESPAPEASPGPGSRPRWTVPAVVALVIAAGVGGWLLRNTLEHHGPVVTSVTNFPGDEETPTLSPDGQQAAFSWNAGDGSNYDIYVIKLGEGGPKRVTTAPEWDYSPVWSPAADQIAFLRSNSATLSGTYADILVVNPDGGPERKIGRVHTIGVELAQKKRQLVWTPDGKWLIVCGSDSDDPEGLLLVSPGGGPMRRLTLPSKGQFDLEPALTPDGRLIVFRRQMGYNNSDLYSVPLGSDYGPAAPERPVVTHAQVQIASPQWEAPGRLLYLAEGRLTRLSTDALGAATDEPRLVKTNVTNCTLVSFSYVSTRPGALLCSCERDEASLWRLDFAPPPQPGVSLKRVTAGRGVSISPDGKRVALESYGEDVQNVWIDEIDGGSPRRLTRAQHGNTGSPAWSPDGRWIAFDSNFEGRPSVYVAAATNGASRRLTNALADFVMPSWSRDGKSIYFAAQIAGRFEVARMPAEGGDFTQITHGGGTSSAESVDGRYVYYNRRVQESWSLRRTNRDGSEDEEIIPSMLDRAFAVAEKGVYFIPMPGADGRSSICFLNIATREPTTITPIQRPQRRPIVIAPNGSFLLFSQFDHWGRDLVLLDGVL